MNTQMTQPPINLSNEASYVNFTYDGTIQDGSSYFDSPSQYFTNLYPGLFVMAAYDINIDEFRSAWDNSHISDLVLRFFEKGDCLHH